MHETAPLGAEQVRRRNTHVREEDLGRILSLAADLLEQSTAFESRPIGLHQNQADAASARGRIRLAGYDEQISAGVESPVLDAKKFADLDLDPSVWSANAAANASDERAEIGHAVHQR